MGLLNIVVVGSVSGAQRNAKNAACTTFSSNAPKTFSGALRRGGVSRFVSLRFVSVLKRSTGQSYFTVDLLHCRACRDDTAPDESYNTVAYRPD